MASGVGIQTNDLYGGLLGLSYRNAVSGPDADCMRLYSAYSKLPYFGGFFISKHAGLCQTWKGLGGEDMKNRIYRRFLLRMLPVVVALLFIIIFSGCRTTNGSIEELCGKTAQALQDAGSSTTSDWTVLGLARWKGETDPDCFDSYYSAVESRVSACNGVLHERKHTEYSRLILVLTAMGKDPTNVAGYNLLLPLADFEQTVFQGVNGAIVALLALDSGNYEIPLNTAGSIRATRELYVQWILDAQLPRGGWSLSGDEPEIDVTAMALQALAGYRQRDDVALAVDKGLEILSARQDENGGYTAYGVQSSEAISQTIIALAELGINPGDPRFVKNDCTLLDALLGFRLTDGTFCHLSGGQRDLIATEQAFCALVALERLEDGESSLYKIN